ncbi:MAG: hypothetical protein AAF772_16475, partial [Acidobacteriota bacterium]
ENEATFVCRLPAADPNAPQADLGGFVVRLRRYADRLGPLIGLGAAQRTPGDLDAINGGLDEAYAILGRFGKTFRSVDPSWPSTFHLDLVRTAKELAKIERQLWMQLREAYESGLGGDLAAPAQTVARRRARPIVLLEKLAQRCALLAQREETIARPSRGDEELRQQIRSFVRADALDTEPLLTDLLLHKKEDLLTFLRRGSDDEQHGPLIDRLWETADLVVLDDTVSLHGHRRAGDPRVLDALASTTAGDARFRVLKQLMAQRQQLDHSFVVACFRNVGVRPNDRDLQLSWRCLVLGHRDAAQRRVAAYKLSAESMWQTIALPMVPISTLVAIGERVTRSRGDEGKKIFFDCVRARLEEAAQSFTTREQLQPLTKLIMLLLDFSFLAETGYFRRFDAILGTFLENAQKAGLRIDYFENLRKTLDQTYNDNKDKPTTAPPAGVRKLPLILQRRLAGERRYLSWFITHPDPRIASETLRHIGVNNIERVLRVNELNGSVMKALLQKPELFTRSAALLAALNHPKCTQQFAQRQISNLGRSKMGQQALRRIANNASANASVRSMAKRLLQQATGASATRR